MSCSTTTLSVGKQLKGAISHRRLYGRCMFLHGVRIVLEFIVISGGNLLNQFSLDARMPCNDQIMGWLRKYA
jgi:hypothetical protein